MENDKILELMTKMYHEMQEGFKNVDKQFKGIDEQFKSVKNEIAENRNAILKLESKIENDRLDNIEGKLDMLQIDVSNLTIKTAYNTKRILNITRNNA